MRLVDISGERLERLRERVSPVVLSALQRSQSLDFLGNMSLTDQIDHALGFAVSAEEVLESAPDTLVDLGTGGGLPGLVLLSYWPECGCTLLDANERRTDFLIEELSGWDRVVPARVVRDRAEVVGHQPAFREQAQAVVSRSFGTPAVVAECAAPLLRPTGIVVVSEPPSKPGPPRWTEEGLALVGLASEVEVHIADRFGYRVLRKVHPTDQRYPRRTGIPAKRPLF